MRNVRIEILFWNAIEHRLRAFWRLAVFLVVAAVPANMAVLVLDATDVALLERSLRNPLVAAAFMLALWVYARYVERRPMADFGLEHSSRWWRDLLGGLSIGAFAACLLALVAIAIGAAEITGEMHNDLPETHFALAWSGQLFRYAGGSLFEEIMSRAILLRIIAETIRGPRMGRRGAVISAWLGTSLIFGALHFANPNASVQSALTLTALGAFLGLGMVLTGSLAIPIGAHLAWNVCLNCVFGIPNSGQLPHATFLATSLHGPKWLTGSAFGLEGGLLCLGAAGVGALLTLGWVRWSTGRAGIHLKLADPPNARA